MGRTCANCVHQSQHKTPYVTERKCLNEGSVRYGVFHSGGFSCEDWEGAEEPQEGGNGNE